ncbi:MAG: nitroreductase family protein [Bacteroidales bacterium]|nr:nitroreductase family protein [Bacteroidales bacterium]
MSFFDLIKTRQSVRKYSGKPVEREKIEKCMVAARLAPSAGNSQPWKYVIVDDFELKEKVAKETYSSLVKFNKFAEQAPVIVVIVIEKAPLVTQIGAMIKKKEFSLIDIGISSEHFCLQAAEQGLGTCMLGWFNEKPIKKLLKIPKNKTIGLLISLGYSESDYKLRDKIRKDTDKILSYNEY